MYDDLAAVQSVALILHGFERCGLRDERLFSGLAAASKEMRFYDVQVCRKDHRTRHFNSRV